MVAMSMKVRIVGNVRRVFLEVLKRWPSLNYGILAQIGYEGRRALYENYLQGQVINLRKYPKDIVGRRTVSYGIARNYKAVKISSYPLNLYNPRAVYSAATSTVRGRIEASLPEYDRRVFQKRLDQIDRKFT